MIETLEANLAISLQWRLKCQVHVGWGRRGVFFFLVRKSNPTRRNCALYARIVAVAVVFTPCDHRGQTGGFAGFVSEACFSRLHSLLSCQERAFRSRGSSRSLLLFYALRQRTLEDLICGTHVKV